MDYRDKRLRTSVHIEIDGLSLVVDTGPDFRQQMLREDIRKLDAVIFTHSHKDHTAGLDDVRAYNFLHSKDMPVYGHLHVLNQLRVEYAYVFESHKYPGIPRLKLIEISDQPFTIGGLSITPLPVMHMNLPVFGFRIGDFSYITDANFIPDTTLEKIQGSRILVLNALQKEKHISHFNLKEAVTMAQQIGAENTYFTHISHKLGTHRSIETELSAGVALAHDGLIVTL